MLDKNNNVRYIGKSSNIQRRLKEHINEAKLGVNSHKNKWILSLLNENELPTIEIIDEVPSIDWVFWEIFYIGLFKSWGFLLTNGTIGGNGTGSGVLKKLTIEHRNKCSLALSGNKNPFFGKKHSDEIMNKIYKPILQYSLDGDFIKEWPSIKNAETVLHVHTISSCCHNKLLSVGGFVWKFKENNEFPAKIDSPKKYRKKIIQFDKNGEFIKKWESISDAEHELNIGHISKVCNNYKTHKTSGGFIWRFE